MVLAETETETYFDHDGNNSGPSSDSDLGERLRDVNSASQRMDEQEQLFYRKRSLPDIHVNRTNVSPQRPRTPPGKTGLTIMDPSVPFTSRNSAISRSYASPRQFTLSASHMGREQSARTDNCGSRTLTNSTGSMDYDDCEEVPLELLKFYKPEPVRVTRSEDIYRRACNKCGVTPSQAYLRQISTNSSISMANTSLSHRTLRPIAVSLVRDSRVDTLDVSGNDFGALGVIYISEMLTVNDTLFELNLSNTNPRREGLEALAKALQQNTALCVLKLESNYLDHRETEFIVKIMKCAPRLSEIYLGHNDLGYESAKLLACELEVNCSLRHLDLQWNHFRKESAKQICKALKVNKGLRSLNISWNGLGKEGCIALAHALPKNESLKELDLTNNRIDLVALPFLLHGLVRNKGLQTLRLAKNPLTTEGVKAVVRAITGAKCMALRYLNTEDIPVDKEFTNLVKKMQADRNIAVDHGVEMYSAIELNMKEHDPHDLNRFDPVMVLVEYMRIDNLRLIDLFQFFDTSGRGLVSRENLRNGVAVLGLPLTEHHLDCIMKDIDKKRDGYIDLEEFMNAQRDMSKVIIQRTTKAKGKGKEDLGLKELRKILKELVEKRNQRNKEKSNIVVTRHAKRDDPRSAKCIDPDQTTRTAQADQAAKKLNSFAGAVTKVKGMNDLAKIEAAKTQAQVDTENGTGTETKTGETPNVLVREDTFMLDSPQVNLGRRKSSFASIVAHYTELQKYSTKEDQNSSGGLGMLPEIHSPDVKMNGTADRLATTWPIAEDYDKSDTDNYLGEMNQSTKIAWATPRLP